MVSTNRTDGQIWIDKKPPYRLKYHVNEVDYVVEVSAIYDIPTAIINNLKTGMVVRFIGEKSITPAVFPEDIENVLGVISSITEIVDPSTGVSSYSASISRSGYLILMDPSSVFLADDLDITKNGWGDDTSGVGAPVYWFVGKTIKSGNTYSYIASSTHPGKLTFSTPSGYKWNKDTVEDPSLNVGYDNLPQIGTIASYTLEGNIITQITLHLNFAKFDSSLEWSWPYLHITHNPIEEGDCGLLSSGSFKIRHGLFGDHPDNLKVRNYCDVLALPSQDSDVEYVISTGFTNDYAGEDRGTTINFSTPEDYYYRISGRVNYEFDKNHPQGV